MSAPASSEIVIRFRTTGAQRLRFFIAQAPRSNVGWLMFAMILVPGAWRILTSPCRSVGGRFLASLIMIGLASVTWVAAITVMGLFAVRAGDEDGAVTLDESGVRSVEDGGDAFFRWEVIGSVREAGGFLYLTSRQGHAIVGVPITAFADARARARFEETVRARMTAA